MERSNEADKIEGLSKQVGVYMINDNISKMIELCIRKKGYLFQLLELTKRQESIIDEDKLDELVNILKEKEEIMEKVDDLDSHFIRLFVQLKEEEKIDSFEKLPIEKYANAKELKALVNEINNIVNNLTILDKNNIAKMKASIEKTKTDLKNVKLSIRANKGYGIGDVGSVFIDEKK